MFQSKVLRRSRRMQFIASVSLGVLALTAFSALAPAKAQEVTAQSEQPEEIIITGTAYGVAKDALMSNVDVLNRSDIDQKPAQGLGDLLNGLPGIRTSGFAPGASRPIIRGLDSFRVLILNNGLGAVDASAVSPDHAVASDPSEAKRIEVLRGPSALMYGGNAIGGIINIIDDRIPTKVPAKGVEGRLAAQASSVDNGKQISLGTRFGQGPFVFSLEATNRQSDDYDTPVGPESRQLTDLEGEAPDTSKSQVNTFVDLKNIGAGVSYIGDFGFVGISAKDTDLRYGLPAHGDETDVSIGLKQRRYDVRSQFKLGNQLFNRLTVDGGYTDYKHTEFEGDEIGTRFISSGYELRANLLRSDMGELSGVVGFNYLNRDFEAIGEEAFVPSTNTQEAGLYAQYRLDKGLWGIEGGARLDTKKIKSDEVAFSKDFNSVSASLGGFWRPTDHNFFGLSLTRSERAPSEPELLANGPHAGTGAYEIGNPAIDSEIGYSLEATGHIMIDQHSRFSLDAHIYSSQFDGFIDLRPTGLVIDDLPVFVYTQTDATFSGIELEAGVNLWREGTRSVRLDMGYDYVKADSDLGNIARISPQSLSATLGYQGDRFDSHIEVRHVKKADNLAEFELPTQSYTAINLFTSYQLSGPISLFGEIRNLTNEEMREHTSAQKDILVGPARNFRGGLIWKF